MSMRRTTRVVGACVLAVLGFALVAVLAFRIGSSSTDTALPRPSPSASATGPKSLSAEQIYEVILPSLVVVRTESAATADVKGENKGLGTGVVIDAAGTILTAYHVVGNAQSIEVEFADGTKSEAFVVLADPGNDVATLTPQARPELVVPAVLGGGVAVGNRVVAMGNPLGLIATTTEGVVSGLNRAINGSEMVSLSGLIQFDAAVNPGSSGGPLLNDRGQVIGVVSSLANPSDIGYFIGIGFAVPIGTALGTTGEGGGPER
ncbi:MAG: trypsin-like peptidase domain-containing protein [Actinomycetota bacterium]|nr:trypsin-like peptidase domain-containing protein [Actinomycetota bacterium]MDP2288861.1 trypsin-like peptidase domain-containing protein [Actinomycetota bacterium]